LANYIPRLSKKYKEEIVPKFVQEKRFKNIMQVPRIHKVVINVGAGKAVANPSYINTVVNDLALISGQKPVVTKAKKAEAGFKIREGLAIGAKVTLRGRKMYDFLDRLISMALPRVRDFEGLSVKSFDGKGNYSFGIKEHLIFHEVDTDKVNEVMGMDVIIVTTALNDQDSKSLLEAFGMPFKKERRQ